VSGAKTTTSSGQRADLDAAYRATHYRVETPDGAFSLRVGQYSPELARLYRQRAHTTSAYLSACNPASRQQAESHNQAASAVLRRQLEASTKPWFGGYTIDPEGQWPPEASFLVLGLTAGESAALGRAHGQNAILVAGPEAIPELVWL
jgi:hypothetical protein